MSTTLPLFWHLSSASKKERIDASVKLISALEQFQAQFIPPSQAANGHEGATKSEDEEEDDEDDQPSGKGDGLELLNAQDVSYSIRRLIRGLASPRESSRLGFAVALTELLSRIHTVTCSQVITLIVDGTKTQGSMTGQEERDMLFARLFGLTSVIKSGLVAREGSLPTSGSTAADVSTSESFRETVIELVALGEKKSWLRESAWWTILLALDALNGSEMSWRHAAVDAVLEVLFVENKEWSPEKVALTLKLQATYPEKEWKKFTSPAFKNPNLLSGASSQTMARILKDSSHDEGEDKSIPKAAAASWKPQLHFVWDVILDVTLPIAEGSEKRIAVFQEFYKVVVDESLFSASSSQQKKYWGFQVFSRALKRVDQESMPMLFTKNFMRSWINHLSNPDRYLHKIAKQMVTEVQSFVQSNPHLGFALILQLTGLNGSRQFDKLTKTKTVENVLSSMTPEGIEEYINYLLQQVNEPEDSEQQDVQSISARRTWVIEQFGALIRNTAIPKNDEWIKMILDWLVVNGLFIVKKKSSKSSVKALHTVPNPQFSDDLRQSCRSRLLMSLADLASQTTTVQAGEKTTKSLGVASDGEFWISKVLDTIQLIEQDTKHISSVTDADEEETALRTKARIVAIRLRGIPEEQETAKGVELLLLAIVLQHHCAGEDDEIDLGVLESCIGAAERMYPEGKKTKKAKKSIDQEVAPEPVDVIVDTIIGFLEKSTAYLRTVGNQVFTLVSSRAVESTIDLILSQLERRNPAELAMDEDDDDEGDAEDADAAEAGEGENASEDASEDASEEEEENEDGEDSGEETDPNEPVDDELRKKIEQALRINGADAGSDDSEDEEDLMDDDQMMAIDEQLAAAFRSRVNEKRSGKGTDAQRQATHFKNRVLDLVDIFLRKQSTSPLVLRFINSLIDLISQSGSDEQQLSDKAKGIIRSRIGKSKDFPTNLTAEEVTELSEALHTRARRIHSPELLSLVSQCCIYLAKVLQGLNEEEIALRHYRESLQDFLTRKNSSLNPGFFLDFFKRSSNSAWSLRRDLLDLASKAVNAYRQCQAYQMLENIVSQLSSLSPSSDEITDFMSTLQKDILQTINDACDEKQSFTSAQLKDLLKIALSAVRQTQRVGAKHSISTKTWDATLWTSSKAKLAQSSRFKESTGLHKMCEQVVRASSQLSKGTSEGPSQPPAKRKADQVDVDEGDATVKEGNKTKRKKPKKDKSSS
ncbi:hypothetical protein BDN72DRAFT_792794 [Pluteus cervinus]|uniref:Uncharacterized protein n=1 Tax=Pluteus cervinus TaxID=181527 RepID=A0ACD3B305_9AGAR|nr:hypothetical protein BDN72DRAFT_792794 [Pluteus cervinus]